MTLDTKQNESQWAQTTSAFHTYLEQTVESLEYRKAIKGDSVPPLNPRKSVLVKQKRIIPMMENSKPDPRVQADKERAKFKPSKTRRYASPLWVSLGDENSGRNNSKTKHTRKKG